MKRSFDEVVKQIIVDGLYALEGKKVSGGGDLSGSVCDGMNEDMAYTGIPFSYLLESHEDMMSFITGNWDKASETYDEWNFSPEEAINVFEEPEKLAYFMIQDNIDALLNDIEFIEENWNDDFILTDEVITNIKEELGLQDVQVSWLHKDYLAATEALESEEIDVKDKAKGEDFNKLVKQIIVDGLHVFKGDKEYGDGQALGSELCYAMNKDHAYISPIYRYFNDDKELMNFIVGNWDKATDFYEYWTQSGADINVFGEADKFVYLMLAHEIEDLIDETEFIEERRDEDFFLTDEAITALTEELGLQDVQVSEWVREEYMDEDQDELAR